MLISVVGREVGEEIGLKGGEGDEDVVGRVADGILGAVFEE